jgi:hypothetical protein
MLLVFITQSIGLSLTGLKAPLVFALFCALMDIIPYFGPYIGAIPAVLVGFTQSPIVGVFCIVSIVVVQLLENNFYQPLIMGHTMKLHPVTIMLGLLIFQHFFGIIGMIVATPVIACGKEILTFINEKFNITIVMVLHELNQASKYSDRLIIMKKGSIVCDGCPNEIVNKEVIKDVYSIECDIDKDPITNKPRIHPIKTIKVA